MENFFISFNGSTTPSDNASISFEKRESGFHFIKSKKKLLETDEFVFSREDAWVIGSGTISYKSLGIREGFMSLAEDMLKDELDAKELYGHYTIIGYHNKKLAVYFDEAGYGAPYIGTNFISSSFLETCKQEQKLTINKDAVFEEVYTGCFLNGKTPFNEIRRIISKTSVHINDVSVALIPVVQPLSRPVLKNRPEALEYTLNEFDNYFHRWSSQLSSLKLDIGLSSGYDSRLMLSLLNKYFPGNFQTHTYWKAVEDNDTKIARALAEKVNLELITIPVRDQKKLSTEEFENILSDACVYYDGVFPSNHGWLREYRTADYRAKVLNGAGIGLSGLSGEQYRNEYGLLNRKYSVQKAIEKVLLENINFHILKRSSFNQEGIGILKKSVQDALSFKSSRKEIDKQDIYRMYCEMWVSSGPGLRNRFENQLSYFLSPFTERSMQRKAYDIVPFTGMGGGFEAALIRKLNPSLAGVVSDYGHNFSHIPVKQKLKDIFSGLLGKQNKAVIKSMTSDKSSYSGAFGKHKHFIDEKLSYLNRFAFPFSLDISRFNNSTNDRLVALSFVLAKFETKIEDDRKN